jgi:hypothetical protein
LSPALEIFGNFFSKVKKSEFFFAKNEKESPYFQYHKIGKKRKRTLF